MCQNTNIEHGYPQFKTTLAYNVISREYNIKLECHVTEESKLFTSNVTRALSSKKYSIDCNGVTFVFLLLQN